MSSQRSPFIGCFIFYKVILSLYFSFFKFLINTSHCSGVLSYFPYNEWYKSCMSFLTHTPRGCLFCSSINNEIMLSNSLVVYLEMSFYSKSLCWVKTSDNILLPGYK